MIELHNAECMEFMSGMDENSVDAIITDPPYFRVKGEEWDNQWESSTKFIEWVGELCEQFQRILKPNGSLYFFASPQMAARVEVKIAERFNVLSSITWRKGSAGKSSVGWSQKTEKEALRAWLPETERVIFAEHFGADNIAKGEAGYEAKCDELRGFVFDPLRAYLDKAREKAGLSLRDVAMEFQAKSGSKTLTGAASNWFKHPEHGLPSRENYEWLQNLIGKNLLPRSYQSIQDEYASLRREYEDLRREYEDLRRPFNITAKDQWSDVWEFDPVAAHPGKHPCEKPLPLLSHILNASTKPGAIVFDPFAGSGSMGHACQMLGRKFIGTELCPDNYAKAKRRLEAIQAQAMLFQPDDYDRVTRDYQESMF